MTAVELVLFFGPPFVILRKLDIITKLLIFVKSINDINITLKGKTLYYFSHYSKTHCRISAREIFEKEQSTNLRVVILKAIRLLCKGKSVVIDDENWYAETRKSYSTLVKQKVANCTLTIVQFVPDVSFGYQQCLWAREWALVYWTLLKDAQCTPLNLCESHEKLDFWFLKRTAVSHLHPPEFPTVNEGFSLVTIEPALACHTLHKWESIIADSHDADLTYKLGTPAVLNKWLSKNPSGRLMIIGLKSKHEKEILDETTQMALVQLASQVSSPIYFTFIDEKCQLDQFSKLPHPGCIAFLQRLHNIHLYHKNTMYVYEGEDHYKAASAVGIRAIKAEKLLANPDMINAVYCGDVTQTLPFLKDIQQFNFHLSTESGKEKGGEVCTEAFIPFLSRARESSSSLVWKYADGKINGLCFKDKLILERYQTQYALAAQPAMPPDKVSPELDKTGKMSSTPPDETSSYSDSYNNSNTKGFGLKNVDLREIAETPGRYNGGFLCKQKIFNLNVELLDCRLKISCNCMGSTGKPYDVEATVSDSSGLIEAHCSCPDPIGRNGRCKHVIGLLLRYKDRNASSTMLEGSRFLPSWMNLANSEVSGHKKGSPLKVSSKTVDKKVIYKGNANTLYCMSQEEFLDTAKEVVKKHEESFTLNSGRSSIQETEKGGSGDVIPTKERTVAKRECRSDVLEELIFGGHHDQNRSSKKFCTEALSSSAEETPTDQMPSKEDKDCVVSAMIPDSLVPETISVILETVESDKESNPWLEGVIGLEKNQESFQDFLDELI